MKIANESLNYPFLSDKTFKMFCRPAAIKDSKISEEKLWDRNYVELPDIDPKKYKTNFTDFAKNYIQPVEDSVLSTNKKFIFAVLADDNGYLPAHNSIYDKPLTGDYKIDLSGNVL